MLTLVVVGIIIVSLVTQTVVETSPESRGLGLGEADYVPRIHKDGASAQSQHHAIHRQAQADACTPDSIELDLRIAVTQCDPEYIAALREAGGSNCDYFAGRFAGDFLTNEIRKCATDGNGTFCVVHDPFLSSQDRSRDMLDVANDIDNLCFESLSETLTNCSSECRLALEELSDRFGCCIHTERSITGDRLGKILTPLVWSRCGVTRPDPCEDTPQLPEPLAEVTCTYLCALSQFFALNCKYLSRKVLQIHEECGASDTVSARETRQTCGFNDKGDLCGITEFDREYILSVYNECYRFYSTNECPTDCKEALQEMRDTYGCCVNNLNTTQAIISDNIESLVTGYDLWSTCGVETPGYCPLPSDLSVYDDFTDCNTCVDNSLTN